MKAKVFRENKEVIIKEVKDVQEALEFFNEKNEEYDDVAWFVFD